MLKKLGTFYPVLLAAFFVLSLFSYNIEEVSITDMLIPLAIVVAGTLALLLALRRFVKNHNKIALVVAYLVVLFFSYGYVRDVVFTDAIVNLKPNIILASTWSVLFVAGVFLILRAHRDFNMLTKLLQVVAVALVLIVVVSVGVGATSLEHAQTSEITNNNNPVLVDMDVLPDIYYIILDMYARNDTLTELFGYNNTEFTNYLASKGFYTATESCSNYGSSYLSVASSLCMNYHKPDITTTESLYMLRDNEAAKFLKSRGYHYISVSSGIDLIDMEHYAEVRMYEGIFGIEVSAFLKSLCDTTVLAPFARVVGGVHGANAITYSFSALAEIPDIEEPTFCYAHILCPHPPWFFTVDGPRGLSLFGPGQNEMIKDGYLGNLEYVNKKVKVLVDILLAKSDVPPIIILQGDHGLVERERGLIESEEFVHRFEILNTYYLPNGGDELLYESISPVNSFRVVFNYYFDTDYELLEDCIWSIDSGVWLKLERE